MGRPTMGERKLVRVTLPLDPVLLAEIDAFVARESRKVPFGKVERSQVLREIVARGWTALQAAHDQAEPPRRTRKAG